MKSAIGNAEDPVRLGAASSFARSGGNVIGVIAARTLGLEPVLWRVQEMADLPAFGQIELTQANALIVLSDALFSSAWWQIIALATEHNLPAMYEGREFVEDGC